MDLQHPAVVGLRNLTIPNTTIDILRSKLERLQKRTTPIEDVMVQSVRDLNENLRPNRNIYNSVTQAYNTYKTSNDTFYSLVDEINRLVDVNRKSENQMAGTRKKRRRLNRRHSRKH